MKDTDFRVHSWSYDHLSMRLTVTQSNGVVEYENVRLGEYNSFKAAVSQSDYLKENILPNHRCHKA